ncbi:peroxiredoxin-like family protein [Amycolatopsis anabasis]|uniref:peroxiredoxin-like family protein n=1 Tax=Amycolatopsis anabasis TaxID=1840409 RepID=UPI00131AFAE3|nr:peroxiredoxin-like family protein [Amycolatopsis anabasis]
MTGPLADRITELQQGIADHLPPEAHAAFSREQHGLAAAGVPAGVAIPGTKLTDHELLDPHGAPIGLFAAIGPRPAVLVFYRGDWCPYCNLTLRTYQQQLLPELTGRGAALVALSPQKPDGSLSTREKNELSYPVLSDPGNAMARELGILTGPTEEARAAQRSLGIDITTGNADGTTGLPMPTTLIVDAERVLRWIDVHPDYTTRSEPADILEALRNS